MKSEIKKERTHLFAPNINIVVMVEFEGKIQEATLSAAIQKAVDHHEVLGCKIVVDEKGNGYYETKEKGAICLERFSGEWEEKITEQERIAFDLKSGELIRFYMKEMEDLTQLLIIAHHLVGDGVSMTCFVEDIINALNGKAISYKKQRLFDMKLIPSDCKLNLVMRMLLNHFNKKWDREGKVFSYSEYQEMFQKYWATHKTKIISATLEENQLHKVEEQAKQHKVSVNSVITTALIRGAGENAEIGMPVSLREKDNQSMVNYTTAISIKEKYDYHKTFWENASHIHQAIYTKLSNSKSKYFLPKFMCSISPTLIDAAYFTAFNGYENKIAKSISNLFGYIKMPKAINLSNLTKITKAYQPGEYSIKKMYFVPPIVPNASGIFGVVTYNNKMIITFHALDDEGFPKKKAYFEQVIKGLYEI